MSVPIRSILVSLTIFLSSCSSTGAIDCQGNFIYNPNAFSPEQQTWIVNASDRWNKWVGRKITSVKPGHSDYCMIDAGSIPDPNHIGEESHRLENITLDLEKMKTLGGGTIIQSRFEKITMHEMGHALGYDHIGNNGEAIMSPVPALDFTDLDRAECIKKGMCTTAIVPDNQSKIE